MADELRIVKEGTAPIDISTGSVGHLVYSVSDTISIKKGWRPKDWHRLKKKLCKSPECGWRSSAACLKCTTAESADAEETFDACIEAMEAKSHESVKY